MRYVAGSVQHAASSTLASAGTLRLSDDLTNAGTPASRGTLRSSGTRD